MEAGVPIGSEAGKGYFIVDGYHLPPVMFTQDEASAMLMAGKLVEKMTDKSVKQAFESALLKIKSVLNDSEKDHLESLHEHIEIWHGSKPAAVPSDHHLTDIQKAVVEKKVLEMEYFSNYNEQLTKREVEPIGLFYYGMSWHLIAWCTLRNGYRDFRIDRIRSFTKTSKSFDHRNLLTLQEYLSTLMQSNREMEKVAVVLTKECARYVGSSKYSYGFVSEENLDGHVRMTFLTSHLNPLCRYLLMFGKSAQIEQPLRAKEIMQELVEELSTYYLSQPVENNIVATR
jgi:predicted DNA-binding transcriptional regulator YafY